ncbi:adhesion G-protein coupled receptor G2-like [Physella acuta]|uniref:adhesion G-protein coupled receptor G2-like n=1 Tax=Physella acuta TaxID=109671 RepID=UPI0027DD792E|nr:adhesion G-protein coupled receptor G2-like [Physella acuta]
MATILGVGRQMAVAWCRQLNGCLSVHDVYGQERQASTDATDDEVLSYISHIGCAISFVALLITVLIYTMFSRLRRDEPSQILYNMCWGLLAFNLCFLLGLAINDDTDAVWCKVLAASMHYSLLAAMFWMAVNAYYMHLSLIRVFNTYIDNFYLKCALAGWGSPFIFVAITLAINKTDNYGLISSHLCWIKHPAIYYGLIAPVAFIIFVNCIVFLKILRLIAKMSTTNSR